MNEHLRYYGRRKAQEDSDSELSGLEEDKTEENRARAQPRLRQDSRDIEKSFFHISGLSLAMPMVVMEKCGVLAPKSVRLLISMALDLQSPL